MFAWSSCKIVCCLIYILQIGNILIGFQDTSDSVKTLFVNTSYDLSCWIRLSPTSDLFFRPGQDTLDEVKPSLT